MEFRVFGGRPGLDTARRALVGLSLATLAAFLFLPSISLLEQFSRATDVDPLQALLGFVIFPGATLRSLEFETSAEILGYTWWFYLPAGVLFGVLLPRRSSRQVKARAALEGALLGGALPLVGGFAAAFAVWAAQGFGARSFHDLAGSVLYAQIFLAPYCALWVAGFAAVHGQRRADGRV